MRLDTTLFITDNEAGSKEPRYVISIDFDGTVQYFTSHDDIANVPGPFPVESVVFGISATSQTLNPERANATIGSMSFDLLDLQSQVTDIFRTQLDSFDVGLRGRTVQFFMGYVSDQGSRETGPSSTGDNPDFEEFVLFQTQIVRNVETKETKYTIQCADIQRQTKKQIFELFLTYLTSSITEADTTIPVLDISGFEGNFHGTSYTDAPSENVIYIQLDGTDEIIRCPVSGISGNTFTGVTRGALGTVARPVEVDVALPSDRRPKVEEYVYLELPAVKAAYAVLTGIIEGTANVLPSSWHADVDPAFVRLTDFQTIGTDLWNPADDNTGVVLRFDGIEKQDAKKFLETEIYLLLGLFSPVYADGQLGLKRMVPSLADSPFVFELNDTNVTGTGNLLHDMEAMQNNMRIDWNWNGERFIRSTIIADAGSIARHGQAPEKRLGFRGLVGTRFTEQVLRQLLTSLRDMYTGPPLRLDVNGFHLFNRVEVGDAAHVDLSNIRDYAALPPPNNLLRTMVVHGMSVDWLGGVKLKLFGSSERADEIPPITAATCLPDSFYPSEGVSLSTIGGLMTGNATNAGTFTLTGDPDMNANGAIFFWDNDLTISSTTTLVIEDNVQLRVKGFITIDGTIDGIGNGHPTDTNLFDLDQHYYWADDRQTGTPGFIGNSQSHGGLIYRSEAGGVIPHWVWVTGGYLTSGLYDAFPNLIIEVEDSGTGAVLGIPADMRGGGGAFGNRAGNAVGVFSPKRQKATGGAGGSGGAALTIICRGGDFGISGLIKLDGDDSLEPTTFFSSEGFHIYGGAGGAGAPGALLWLLDGSSVTFPDIAGHFSAVTGDVPAQFALPFSTGLGQNRSLSETNAPVKNMAPYLANAIRNFDQSGVNFRISFLPCDLTPEDDQDVLVPAPTALVAFSVLNGVLLQWINQEPGTFDHIEIHKSDENDRSTATLLATTQGSLFTDTPDNVARGINYYWIRAVDIDGNVSLFAPNTTNGVIGQPSRERRNWALDPEFDIGNPVPNWPSNVNGSQTDFWRFNAPSGTSTGDFIVGGGQAGSNAIDITQDGSSNGAVLEHKKRQQWKGDSGTFLFQIKYQTIGTADALDHDNFVVFICVAIEEFGGVLSCGGVNLYTLPRTAPGVWATFETVESIGFFNFNYVAFQVGFNDDQGTADTLRIDSITIQALGPEFGAIANLTGLKVPGLVPLAQSADATKVLRGDGTWATVGDSGISIINIQSGAYTLVLSDLGRTIRKATSTPAITHTIPSNASVAFPIGTFVGWHNDGTVDMSIAITTDTLTGTDAATGTRTLGPSGTAVIQKVAATEWKYAASDL